MKNNNKKWKMEKSIKNSGWLVMMFACIAKYGKICIHRLKIAIKLGKHENMVSTIR
jgi:hypothetical protein